MNIIIPMAGRGTRLRPHTLDGAETADSGSRQSPSFNGSWKTWWRLTITKVDEIAYIVGDLGMDVERELVSIAEGLGVRGRIYHQEKALGVGHAIYCAWESLSGPCLIAFADTLFKADFSFNPNEDGVIWVERVKDPSAFGVVKLDKDGYITDFVEKPTEFVSDMAIVGIYYFREGEKLRSALNRIINDDLKEKNEFQLTTALELLKNEGVRFRTGEIEEWLDCGNKEAILYSNQRMLEIHRNSGLVSGSVTIENSVIIEPCFIGENAVIRNSVIGPHVSVGYNSTVENTVITNSIIQNESQIMNALLENSMVGNSSIFSGSKDELNLGDFSNFSKG